MTNPLERIASVDLRLAADEAAQHVNRVGGLDLHVVAERGAALVDRLRSMPSPIELFNIATIPVLIA